jgi:hypothetical protein
MLLRDRTLERAIALAGLDRFSLRRLGQGGRNGAPRDTRTYVR